MICVKTAERIIEILSLSDRPIILVFGHQESLRKSDGFTPNGGAKYKGEGVAIFDQYMRRYLGKGKRYACYYGRRILSRMCSIEWCHFR